MTHTKEFTLTATMSFEQKIIFFQFPKQQLSFQFIIELITSSPLIHYDDYNDFFGGGGRDRAFSSRFQPFMTFFNWICARRNQWGNSYSD